MLYGSPVDGEPISYWSELQALSRALAQSSVPLRVGAATADSLAKFLMRAYSGKDLVLYLSAHGVRDAPDRLGLGLEEASGRKHVLWQEQLEELLAAHEAELQQVFLVFLGACWSDEIAQVFVERGCRHVIALRGRVLERAVRQFAQVFFERLAAGVSLLKSFEGARARLRIDPDCEVVAASESFVLFGQRSADAERLGAVARTGVLEESPSQLDPEPLQRDFEDAAVCLSAEMPSPNPYFVGRGEYLHHILQCFKQHRACVVHGARGMGKRALGQEFARYASSPGRRFSCCAAVVELAAPGATALAGALLEELARLTAQCLGPLPVGACDPGSPAAAVDGAAAPRIASSLQQLERRRCGAVLLVISDRGGAISSGAEARALLGEVLERTHRTCIVICSPEPIYGSLGPRRAVNLPLGGLGSQDAARLFLKYVNRRLGPKDFLDGREPPLGPSDLWRLLSEHPLLRRLDGNPRRIREVASEKVVPNGPSLLDLAAGLAAAGPPDGAPLAPAQAAAQPEAGERSPKVPVWAQSAWKAGGA